MWRRTLPLKRARVLRPTASSRACRSWSTAQCLWRSYTSTGGCSPGGSGFPCSSRGCSKSSVFCCWVCSAKSESASSVFQALYNVMIKRSLPLVNGDTNVLLVYNVGLSSLLFIPVVFIAGEANVFQNLPWTPDSDDFYTVWASLLFSGLLATMMNLASYVCVKATSPLTFNIVGITKSIVQTVGGIVFLGDLVTAVSLLGISLS
eukprot:Polyplicarium_translucidae@DN2623_c0_g1_i2.p1